MRRPDAAELILVSGVGWILVGDVHLHRHGRRMVTDVLRTPPALVALSIVVAHVLDVLGWLDPFRLAGRLIPRKEPSS